MLHKFMFAGILGAVYSIIVMAFLDFPYAMYVSVPGALVLGWFSNDIFAFILGEK